MTEEKLDALLSRQVSDDVRRARADCVVETNADTLAAARGQLGACFGALIAAHRPSWEVWRGSPGAIRAVTLDLDDTLWPVMPPILKAKEVLDAGIERLLPRAAAAGALQADVMKAGLEAARAGNPRVGHDLTELRRLSLLSYGDDVAAVDEVVAAFVRARSNVEPFLWPDVRDAIRALRDAGLAVGALTDGNCDVAVSVGDLFDFAVTAGDAGAEKPAAAPFLMAAAAAGCHPRHVVHLGDSVAKDLRGALDAGMSAVLVTRPEVPPPKELPPEDPRWTRAESLAAAVAGILERHADSGS